MPDYLFPYNSLADKWVGNLKSDYGTGVLSIVGLVTTEVVSIEIPRVTDPDINNDSHWTPLKQNDSPVTLRAGHNAEQILGNIYVRISKPIGVSGNTYTVRFA